MSALNKSIATVCTFGVHFVGNISQEAADGGGEGGGHPIPVVSRALC